MRLSCIKHGRKCVLCPAYLKTEERFGQPAGANRLPLGWLWSSAPGPGAQDLRPSEDELQRRRQKTNCSAAVAGSELQGSHGHCPGWAEGHRGQDWAEGHGLGWAGLRGTGWAAGHNGKGCGASAAPAAPRLP